MRVNRIDVVINRLANKERTYLYNEMFDLSKEHQISGRFGNDYIELDNVPKVLLKKLKELGIKFSKIKK